MAKKKPSSAKSDQKPADSAPAPEPAPVMGRPTDWRPEYAREAMLLCQLGATDAQLADAFDVTIRTINRWKISHAEFAEAIRKGKEPADDRVEDTLYHRAMGTEYEKAVPFKLKKVIYGSDGKKIQEEERIEVVMVKEVIPADTTALIFWLKNRRAKDWRDIQKHEHGKAGDFDSLDDSQLLDEITQQTRELAEIDPEFAKELGRRPKAATKH